MFNWPTKKKSVGALRDEVLRERERQREADRRPVQGRKIAWAPALYADSKTDFHDIRAGCDKDDLRERVARLETLLENARATASEENMWKEMLQDSLTKMGAKIGKQEGEIESLQAENELLRAELLAAKAAGKETKLVEELDGMLCCPISMQLFKDPVVSKVSGHSYERKDIEEWLLKNRFCPVTRHNMTRAHLVSNFALAGVAEAFRAYQAQ